VNLTARSAQVLCTRPLLRQTAQELAVIATMNTSCPPIPTLTPPRPVRRRRIQFSLLTLMLLTLLGGSAAALWVHWEPWFLERTLETKKAVAMAKFSPDGLRIIAHDGAEVTSWNLADGSATIVKPLERLGMDKPDEFDGFGILTDEERESIRLERTIINPGVIQLDTRISSLVFSDHHLVVAFDVQQLRVFETARFPGHQFISPDGPAEHGLRVFEPSGKVAFGFSDGIGEFKISPDSKQMLTFDPDRHTRVWSIPDGALLGEWAPGPYEIPLTVFFHGNQAIALSREVEGERKFSFKLHSILNPSDVRIASLLSEAGLAFVSSDGKRLLVCDAKPEKLFLYDTSTGSPLSSTRVHTSELKCEGADFIGDGRILVKLSEECKAGVEKLLLWDPVANSSVEIPNRSDGSASATGDRVATWYEASHRGHYRIFFDVWSGRTGELLFEFPSVGRHDYQPALSFSPDGFELMVPSDDGKIQVWRRRHDERWWGVMELPEFWITLLFVFAFVWKLRSGRSNAFAY
jgi:WD40 repeat protein